MGRGRRLASVATALALIVSGVWATGSASSSQVQEVGKITVDAAARRAVGPIVEAGVTYLVEATGVYSYDRSGSLADAECSTMGVSTRFERNRNAVIDPSDRYDLQINGRSVHWKAAAADGFGCDPTHTYRVAYRPTKTGPIKFSINEKMAKRGNNVGTIDVVVTRSLLDLDGLPAPEISMTSSNDEQPTLSLADTVIVDSKNPNGTISPVPAIAGQSYLLTVKGRYWWGYGYADAECSDSRVDPSWQRDRFRQISTTDLLDLHIDGRHVAWEAQSPNLDGCDSTSNIYQVVYVPSQTGLMTFRINDKGHGDNEGVLAVSVFQIEDTPTDRVVVNAADADGETYEGLQLDRQYRFDSTGTYQWYTGGSGYNADAECATAPNRSNYHENLFQGQTSSKDLLDLLVDNKEVTWQPKNGSGACDPQNQYSHKMIARKSSVTFRIDDVPASYADNGGQLVVLIYTRAA